jgi:ubiquinone/menaquinone biosynthesis C-methylase UbiE
MSQKPSEKSITEARNRFNQSLKRREYQTLIADDVQLARLIQLLNIEVYGKYLDLATGTGYVGLAIAEQYPQSSVICLDIANEVIEENQKLSNIAFQVFDGIQFPDFPFQFDGIICRYALHHFPQIDTTLTEIRRVLKNKQRVVISDSVRHEQDDQDFINRFQALKKDGHIKMYSQNEMLRLFKKHNFTQLAFFESKLRASIDKTPEHKALLHEISPENKRRYEVKTVDNKISLTYNILNIAFKKNK